MIEFDETTDPPGLELYDTVEQRRLHMRTSKRVSAEPTAEDQFCFPVDTACTLETESLVFNQFYTVDIHDETGRSNHRLKAGKSFSFSDLGQFIGLSGPIKVYCRTEESGQIKTGINSIHITFNQPTKVEIGARSYHERPVATITTTDEPFALMETVSKLSSALKTTSPERAWPTLRGHPPLIERGPELDIPSGLECPETDVTIEVPPSYGNIYTVAPLAFYLGAEVQSGTEPAIITDIERYDLGVETRLEDDVARTLKHIFLLDCIVRTEGIYQDDIQGRSILESKIPFDITETYNMGLTDRINQYFNVPFDITEPHVPRWPLTAYIPSTPDSVELLPFIVNELGVIREPNGKRIKTDATQFTTNSATEQFVRSTSYRSPVFTQGTGENEFDLVEPDVTDESIEHAWFSSEIPHGASKATIEAYKNQLSRQARKESIEILLVCNDVRMIEEHDVLDEAYGAREMLPFDVHSEFGVSTDRLTTLLTEGGYDFLHYIGHATPNGLECPDGELDVRTLSSIDLGVFFLNACHSYDQGLAMTKRGAFGGVGTLGDVVNAHAVEIGETMARLLNLGFPLRAALELARKTTRHGEQYLIVGDGSADIAQSDGGAPGVLKLEESEQGRKLTGYIYPSKEFRVGSIGKLNCDIDKWYHIIPKIITIDGLEDSSLQDYVTWINTPIIKNNNIIWNNELDISDIFN